MAYGIWLGTGRSSLGDHNLERSIWLSVPIKQERHQISKESVTRIRNPCSSSDNSLIVPVPIDRKRAIFQPNVLPFRHLPPCRDPSVRKFPYISLCSRR